MSETKGKYLSISAELEDLKKKIALEEQEHQNLLQKHEEMVSQLQQEKVNTDKFLDKFRHVFRQSKNRL